MNDRKGSYPAVWGGIECTINRVGNEFKDQLAYSGHYDRPGDLAAIASLGIGTIRYPILWEKHQLTKDGPIDWRWTDGQLAELRDYGITPIAGFSASRKRPIFYKFTGPGISSFTGSLRI